MLHKYGPKCPIVVDDISDEANLQYGGLYERLYIVLDDVIVYQSERVQWDIVWKKLRND